MQPNDPLTARAQHGNTTVAAHYAHMLRRWDRSREEARRVSGNAERLRRHSQELVRQSETLLAQTKQLHKLSKQNRQRQPTAIPQQTKPFVATARRMPWRREQVNEAEGPILVWVAPGYQEF